MRDSRRRDADCESVSGDVRDDDFTRVGDGGGEARGEHDEGTSGEYTTVRRRRARREPDVGVRADVHGDVWGFWAREVSRQARRRAGFGVFRADLALHGIQRVQLGRRVADGDARASVG